ncbi:MAG: Fur family transcriptional regulator [Phycisphaerales bacterium JB043]
MTTRRNTQQQDAIRNAIQGAGRPLSIDEIHSMAQRDVPALGLRTVYRVVDRLLQDGEITRVHIAGNTDRFESAEIASTHHHHFRCETCDRVFDVTPCVGRLERMLPKGFTLSGHEVLLWGSCSDCAN